MENRNNGSENSQDYKPTYNQSYDQNYNNAYNQNNNQRYEGNDYLYDRQRQPVIDRGVKKSNNGLIVFTLSLAIVAIISCVVLAVLLFNDKDPEEKNVSKEDEVAVIDESGETEETVEAETVDIKEIETTPEPTTIPVGRTMYVVVNDYLVLRSGPGTGYSEKARMYRGDAVYVIEYVTDDFARVTYNGAEGYASKHYLSDTKPAPLYTWNYSEYEIETIVAQSLNWYVNAVTTGNTSGAERYFSGKIRQTEINNAASMASKVASERLISVRCHSFKRISSTRVSVVRESDIEIVELSGKSRIASESRVYVLENTGNGTYIVDIHK